MEVAKIKSFLAQLVALRDGCKAIWNEAKLVASSLQIKVKLFRDRDRNCISRKRRRSSQYENAPHKNVNKMNRDYSTSESAYFMCSIGYCYGRAYSSFQYSKTDF